MILPTKKLFNIWLVAMMFGWVLLVMVILFNAEGLPFIAKATTSIAAFICLMGTLFYTILDPLGKLFTSLKKVEEDRITYQEGILWAKRWTEAVKRHAAEQAGFDSKKLKLIVTKLEKDGWTGDK